jgi:DNA methylase
MPTNDDATQSKTVQPKKKLKKVQPPPLPLGEEFSPEALLELHVKKFRENGFPDADEYVLSGGKRHPRPLTLEEKKAHYRKLQRVNFDALIRPKIIDGIEQKVIMQTREGLKLAWSYFHHRWGIECSDKQSPMQVFEDEESLRTGLKKVRYLSPQGINEKTVQHNIGITSGAQTVSNFRPTAAGAIYRYFLPPSRFPKGGVVWDMSMGFGGRLFGAMACGAVSKYIGTDPSTPTFEGLQRIVEEFNFHERTELHKLGSQEFVPDHESLDLCFTSPPYRDTEKYTNEETQSYKEFDTKEKWLHGFMEQTLRNCHRGLKPGAICAVNIESVKSYPTVCEDMIKVAEQLGFKLVDVLKLTLSRLPGSKLKATQPYKYERVFVFQR